MWHKITVAAVLSLLMLSDIALANDAADQAELVRLREDVRKYQRLEQWKAVNKTYTRMQKFAEKNNKLSLSPDDHLKGAMASSSLGNLNDVVLRLRASKAALDGAPNAASIRQQVEPWLEQLLAETSELSISLRGPGELSLEPMPFSPELQDGVRFAETQLNEHGAFEGRLPFGSYEYARARFRVSSDGLFKLPPKSDDPEAVTDDSIIVDKQEIEEDRKAWENSAFNQAVDTREEAVTDRDDVQEPSSSGFALAEVSSFHGGFFMGPSFLFVGDGNEPAPKPGSFFGINLGGNLSYAITKTDLRTYVSLFPMYYFSPQGSIYPTQREDGVSATEDTREPFFVETVLTLTAGVGTEKWSVHAGPTVYRMDVNLTECNNACMASPNGGVEGHTNGFGGTFFAQGSFWKGLGIVAYGGASYDGNISVGRTGLQLAYQW